MNDQTPQERTLTDDPAVHRAVLGPRRQPLLWITRSAWLFFAIVIVFHLVRLAVDLWGWI